MSSTYQWPLSWSHSETRVTCWPPWSICPTCGTSDPTAPSPGPGCCHPLCTGSCSSWHSSAQGGAVLPWPCAATKAGVSLQSGDICSGQRQQQQPPPRILPAQSGKASSTASTSQSLPPHPGTVTAHLQHRPSPLRPPGALHGWQSPPGPPAPSSPAAPALHTPHFSDGRTGKMLLLRSCYLDVSPQAEPGQGDTSVTSPADSHARCAPSSPSIPRAGRQHIPNPRHADRAERSPVNTHSPEQAEGFGIEEQRAPPAPTGLQPQDVSWASPAPAGALPWAGSAPIASSVLPAKVRAR